LPNRKIAQMQRVFFEELDYMNADNAQLSNNLRQYKHLDNN